jgi:hypothetical protein
MELPCEVLFTEKRISYEKENIATRNVGPEHWSGGWPGSGL